MKFIAKYYGKYNKIVEKNSFEAEDWDEAEDIYMNRFYELVKSLGRLNKGHLHCCDDD